MNLSKWTFIPPLREGLSCWSRTTDRGEFLAYVKSKGGQMVIVSNGSSAQNSRSGASFGLWCSRLGEGTVYCDVRKETQLL